MPPLRHSVRALGYAGLLPQVACLAVAISRDADWMMPAALYGLFYAAIILSFLGGIWWGFAMRRSEGQGALATLSVLPSLAAFFIIVGVLAAQNEGWPVERCYLWASVALAVSLAATLLVDRRLEGSGEAPPGWTRFRATLSLALATLTLLIGVVVAAYIRSVTYI